MRNFYAKLVLVFVFPTVCFSQTPTTITLSVSQDAAIGYHDGANTANNNYGTATHGSAFWIPASAAPPPGVNANRALIAFNLNAIPANATVISAYLNLYAHGPIGIYPGHFGSNPSYLERITQSWQEMTATWNNQPASTNLNSVILPQSSSATQDYLNINVLTLVQDMINNPASSFGFKLKLVTEAVTNGMVFCSNNNPDVLKRPTLVVTYSICTEPLLQVTSSNTYICSGNQAYLYGAGPAVANILWFNSQGSTQSIGTGNVFATPVLTANSTPSVYTFYAGNNACKNELKSSINITVNPLPQLSIQSPQSILCVGQTTTLTALGASNYSWTQNSTQFSTAQSVVVSPNATTVYSVTGTNMYNCTSASLFSLSVAECLGIPAVNNSIDLSIFPNPTNGHFRVVISQGQSIYYSLEVEDLQGRLIAAFELSGPVTDINGLTLAKGIYMCRVKEKGQTIQLKKLVIN